MQSITTSVRIQPKLREDLKALATHSSHGMNWLIEQAISDLRFLKDTGLHAGASEELSDWETSHDNEGWIE